MDSCMSSCIKYLVFIINFCFFACGAVITGFGAYLQIEMKNYIEFLDSSYVNSAIVLVIVGVIIMLISFFGCCGAIMENTCMMYSFAIFMTLILLAEVGGAIAVLIYKDDIDQIIDDGMNDGMDNYQQADYDGVTATWDELQSEFECCGVSNYTTWGDSDWGKDPEHVGDVPDSCCTEGATTGCGKGQLTSPTHIYTDGCYDKFKDEIRDDISLVGGVGAGIGLIQLVGIVVACCLGRKMKDNNMFV